MAPKTDSSDGVEPALLVTGFGRFGDHDYNPSADAARGAADAVDTDAHLLDVTYDTAARFAPAQLNAGGDRPVLFLHFGLGAQRQHVCFERRALNERDGRPDIAESRRGVDLPPRQPLLDDNRDHRLTRLQLEQVCRNYDEIRPEGLPSGRISDDCGRYVCNAIYYHSLRTCQRRRRTGASADALFVHIPMLPPDDARRLGATIATVLY